MSPRQSKSIRFPAGKNAVGLIIGEEDFKLMAGAIGPCHGAKIEDFLAAAPVVTGGRFLSTDDPIIEKVLGAVVVEVRGYMRLDREHDGVTRSIPKRGSTAERLLVLYVIIENHMVKGRPNGLPHGGGLRRQAE